MVNLKKDQFAYTELLQIRINKQMKKDIEEFLTQETERTGKRYTQSDFIRDSIAIRLEGKTINIEDRMATGVILGEKIIEARKQGKISKNAINNAIIDVLFPDEESQKQIEVIKNHTQRTIEIIVAEENIAYIEGSNIPPEVKERLIKRIKADFKLNEE